MRVLLKDLKTFSVCPAYYQFSKGKESTLESHKQAVIQSVIKKSYIQATETGYRVDWRTIVGWVDAKVFCKIDITNEESLKAGKSVSEQILKSIQVWYDKLYLLENHHSYTNLTLSRELGGHIVTGDIPILQLATSPIISIISDIGIKKIEIYNDLELQGLAWLVLKELSCDLVVIRYLSIGPQGGLETLETVTPSRKSKGIEGALRETLCGLRENFSYPSRTPQCRSCEFFLRCRL